MSKSSLNLPHRKAFCVFLCLLAFFCISVSSYAQKVTGDYKDQSLKTILEEIAKQAGMELSYSNQFVDFNKTVSLKIENLTVDQALINVLKGTDMGFSITNKKILIFTKEKNTVSAAPGQVKKVTGVVTDDETKETIPGVMVKIKGKSVGTATDVDGAYTLDIAEGEAATLQFSYVGYQPVEVNVGNKGKIDVVMHIMAETIEEVVVVGYGIQKKKDLTSSISSLKPKDFNKGIVSNNPLQMLDGKVAGLNITQVNGTDPNAALNIQLRGVSSVKGTKDVLIVIDGIPGGDLSTVIQSDIESIDILKDGSAAAIYGTNGTNGVILVTTKKGKTGAASVEYEGMFSTETVAKKLDVLSKEQYLQFGKDKNIAYQDFGHETDWFDVLVQTPFNQSHNLSIGGGTESTSYRASLTYKNQEGITSVPTTRETLNGRISISQQMFSNKLRFDMNLAYSNINSRYTDYTVFEQSITRNPTEPVYNDDGTYFYPAGSEEFAFNPVARLKNIENGEEFNRFMGDFRGTLEVIRGLKASMMLGLRKNMDLTHYYDSRTSEGSLERGDSGHAKRETRAGSDKTLEATVEYAKLINKHSFTVMGGYSWQDFIRENYWAENRGFISDAYKWNNLDAGSYLKNGTAGMDSGKNSYKLIAFLGRATYNYDNKYLLTGSVRREGSSRFGANNKWGLFPAASLGWRFSSESFMEGMTWLTDAKLRAGYGVTGNQMSESYISIARMGMQQSIWQGDKYIKSYGLSTNPNYNLKWETKTEFNIGLDLSMLNNRLGTNIDLYSRKNSDLLYEVQASVPSLIHGTVWANVGEMESKGIELNVYGNPVRTKDFNWDISANFSYNQSKLLSLSNDQYVSAANYLEFGNLPAPGNLGNTIRLEEGGDVGNFYGRVFEGFTSDGKWIFKKIEGTPDNKTVIGNGVPDYFAGLNTTLSYKKFDLTVSFKGAFKFDVLNTKEIYYGNRVTYPSNLLATVLTRHKDLNDSPQYSDYYLEKGDYVKLNDLTLGYTFNTSKIEYLKKLRVYLNAANLFTITNYSGVDPEVASNGFETGIDWRKYYPRTQTFTLGVSIGF